MKQQILLAVIILTTAIPLYSMRRGNDTSKPKQKKHVYHRNQALPKVPVKPSVSLTALTQPSPNPAPLIPTQQTPAADELEGRRPPCNLAKTITTAAICLGSSYLLYKAISGPRVTYMRGMRMVELP